MQKWSSRSSFTLGNQKFISRNRRSRLCSKQRDTVRISVLWSLLSMCLCFAFFGLIWFTCNTNQICYVAVFLQHTGNAFPTFPLQPIILEVKLNDRCVVLKQEDYSTNEHMCNRSFSVLWYTKISIKRFLSKLHSFTCYLIVKTIKHEFHGHCYSLYLHMLSS